MERVLAFERLVRAVGFEAARRLGSDSFVGWEADFLGLALAAIAESERRASVLDSLAAFRSLFGAAAPRG